MRVGIPLGPTEKDAGGTRSVAKMNRLPTMCKIDRRNFSNASVQQFCDKRVEFCSQPFPLHDRSGGGSLWALQCVYPSSYRPLNCTAGNGAPFGGFANRNDWIAQTVPTGCELLSTFVWQNQLCVFATPAFPFRTLPVPTSISHQSQPRESAILC